MSKNTKLRNKEIEDRAIEFVIAEYPNAKRVKSGSGYDLKIGKKIVEVKGTATSSWKQNIFFSRPNEHEIWEKQKGNYWLFRVYNVGSPNISLKEIPGKDIDAVIDPRWRIRIKRQVIRNA